MPSDVPANEAETSASNNISTPQEETNATVLPEQPTVQDIEDDDFDEEVEGGADENGQDAPFYWKQARENLLTEAGLRMFELAYQHRNEEYESARKAIDKEYEALSPRLKRKGRSGRRHGGPFINHITALEELGLMYRSEEGGQVMLRSTPAGDQAALLLEKLPNALRVIPYFLLELVSRYRLNNPLAKYSKNAALGKEVRESDVFPYWTIYKLLRELGYLTKDELARFVFKLKSHSDIPSVIARIKEFRNDSAAGMSAADIDEKYGKPLSGAPAQPKYIMGRAGYQTGVIELKSDTYRLNPAYIPFVDQVLSSEPQHDELGEEAWVKQYGAPVSSTYELYQPFDPKTLRDPITSELTDDDPILQEVHRLIFEDNVGGVLLVGAPGTGKSWYARQIAIKLANGDQGRMREVQFHPSYQYEDFVEGLVPDSSGKFRLVDRHLLQMAAIAEETDGLVVIVIDEFSRTDPARVLGEAMTYMEGSLRGIPFYLPSGRCVTIPKNLIFLATMNPEDRSVDEIDAAMERRWAKIHLRPDPNKMRDFLQKNGAPASIAPSVLTFFSDLQKHLELGHAFFRTVKDIPSLERLWETQLKYVVRKRFRYDEDAQREIEKLWSTCSTGAKAAMNAELQPAEGVPEGDANT